MRIVAEVKAIYLRRRRESRRMLANGAASPAGRTILIVGPTFIHGDTEQDKLSATFPSVLGLKKQSEINYLFNPDKLPAETFFN